MSEIDVPQTSPLIDIATCQLSDPISTYQRLYGNESANTINYVAQLIRGEMSETSLQDAMRDMYTQVIEHPLAESALTYNYTLDWDKSDKRWTLRLGNRLLDDVYDEAVNNISKQIPEFEIRRNAINSSNYEQLREGRKNSDQRTFVEFSPSPSMSTPSEKTAAVNRGYWGNDSVFLYEYQNGQEKVTQMWLPAQDLNDYSNLLSEIGIEKIENLSNESIMRASTFVDTSQLNKITMFIEERQSPLKNELAEKIRTHSNSIIWEKLQNEISEPLIKAATYVYKDIAFGKVEKSNEISEYLNNLAKILARIQFGFRLFIQETVGAGRIETNSSHMSYNEYLSLSADQQIEELFSNKYTMTGCGVSQEFNLFGKADSIVNIGGISGRKDVVYCEACQKGGLNGFVGHVDNSDASTYFDRCPIGHSLKC